ncbi:MAG: hypothetical protein AAFV45_03755 [Pseudomonadota bacterium]
MLHRTISRFCGVAIAAGFASSLLFSATSYAADFGGDCCADLEERIAELEATTVRKGNRKVSLFIYGEVNQSVMFWDDQAESNAYVLTNSTTKNKVGFEGQARINSEWTAGYRIELDLSIAASDFADQGNASFVNYNRTAGTAFIDSFTGVGDDGPTPVRIRHANWFLKNDRFGRVIVGQGSQATDGIAEIDLSGSTSVALSSVETWNETFFVRDEDGFSPQIAGRATIGALLNGQGSPSFIADLFIGNLDGGRGNFVHYVSPSFAGFTFSAAWGEDDDWDVALRYAGTVRDFQVAAGIGYRDGVTVDTETLLDLTNNVELDQKALVASGSILHQPTGLFATFAGGQVEYDPVNGSFFSLNDPETGAALNDFINGQIALEDAKYFYAKAGVFRKFMPIGKTSIYGEYYTAWDIGLDLANTNVVSIFRSQDDLLEQSHMIGFGVVQHIDSAAMEVYAAYRHYWADDVTDLAFQIRNGQPGDYDIQMDTVMTGARIKF